MGATELAVLGLLFKIIASLLALLVAVVGWIGLRIHSRLDAISTSLSEIKTDVHVQIVQVKAEFIGLERRVTLIESDCKRRCGQ